MPTTEIKSKEELKKMCERTGTECVICIEDWGVGDVVKEMPCQHKFHGGCVGVKVTMMKLGERFRVLIPETTFVDVESRVLIPETTFVGVEYREEDGEPSASKEAIEKMPTTEIKSKEELKKMCERTGTECVICIED
nr:E3 ubiquitin-protein ligase RING1 [Tanacetum cinerariifolium]